MEDDENKGGGGHEDKDETGGEGKMEDEGLECEGSIKLTI